MTDYRLLLYLLAISQFLLGLGAGLFSYQAFRAARQPKIALTVLLGWTILSIHTALLFLSYSHIYLFPQQQTLRFFLPICGLLLLAYSMYRGTQIARFRTGALSILEHKQTTTIQHLNDAAKRFDEISRRV